MSIKKSLDKYQTVFELINAELRIKISNKRFVNKMEENSFIKTNKKLRSLFRSRK